MGVIAAEASAVQPLRAEPKHHLVSPLYDWIFFILSPLIALALGIFLAQTGVGEGQVNVYGVQRSATAMFIGAFISAHLFIVVFRSHLNKQIFQTHPYRFTVVPAVLFLACWMSMWAILLAVLVATWWDVYHSAQQTFGLGRIYDRLHGNDVQAGRTLDQILNTLLYAGPILGGASLMYHLDDFLNFDEVGAFFLTAVPARAFGIQAYLAIGLLTFGSLFLAYYLYAYYRLYRQGYNVSVQKVVLLVSTAACSIYTWGFDSFGKALFIMNFFHALQYFALVAWSERKVIGERLRIGGAGLSLPASFGILLAIGFAYGIWDVLYSVAPNMTRFTLAISITVSLMHFWYDGFIWSVRKKQI
jgi:hypothetical protein